MVNVIKIVGVLKMSKEHLQDLIDKFIDEKGDRNIQVTFSFGRLGYLYTIGWKFCSKCSIIFKIDDLRCPLCGKPLRTRPKNRRLWRYRK